MEFLATGAFAQDDLALNHSCVLIINLVLIRVKKTQSWAYTTVRSFQILEMMRVLLGRKQGAIKLGLGGVLLNQSTGIITNFVGYLLNSTINTNVDIIHQFAMKLFYPSFKKVL